MREWLVRVHTWLSQWASLSPRRPKQDRRDWGASTAVWEWHDPMRTWFSYGASLSPKRS